MNEKLDLSFVKKLNDDGFKFVRTCQECGHKQEDIEPAIYTELTNTYRDRKCKKCKSEALDYGSRVYNKPQYDEDE